MNTGVFSREKVVEELENQFAQSPDGENFYTYGQHNAVWELMILALEIEEGPFALRNKARGLVDAFSLSQKTGFSSSSETQYWLCAVMMAANPNAFKAAQNVVEGRTANNNHQVYKMALQTYQAAERILKAYQKNRAVIHFQTSLADNISVAQLVGAMGVLAVRAYNKNADVQRNKDIADTVHSILKDTNTTTRYEFARFFMSEYDPKFKEGYTANKREFSVVAPDKKSKEDEKVVSLDKFRRNKTGSKGPAPRGVQ